MAAPRPLAEVAAEVVADMRLRQRILRVMGLGPRPTVELIAALVRRHPNRHEADAVLDDFAAISPADLVATGGDRLLLSIVRVVRG